jgi:hypothetical protein
MATDQSKISPPYMSYGVFKSAIDTLAESTVPTGPLDRRVLDNLSGADHGALISGLRFLGYVDEERRATEGYRNLVAAAKEPAKYAQLLMEMLVKYDPIIGDLDIEFGTAAELEKAFRDYGVPQGQMLTKTIRFYIKAVQEVGIKVSPHILKAKPRMSRNGSKKGDKATTNRGARDGQQSIKEHVTPKGFERMSVPGMPEAFIQYPLSLTEAHCNLFTAMITTLRAFAKVQVGGKENSE